MASQPLISATASTVTMRRATPDDAAVCGRIAYEAFHAISSAHNFPCDFPNAEVPKEKLGLMFSHPHFYSVVAEEGGKIVGSNCLDERGPIRGVGPITVAPKAQNRGIGHALMKAVLDRAQQGNALGIRLLQSAYHNRSMALYSRLGFQAREPISNLQGPAIKKSLPGYTVRMAEKADVEACNRLCRQVHGHERGGELADAVEQGTALLAESGGRIRAYATGLAFFAHAVAESNSDLQALIASADAFQGPGILVPTRNASLLQWCLEHGLRIVQPLTLMTIGLYNEPQGAYLPSILY